MNPGAGVKTLKSTPKQNTLNPWVQSSPLTNAYAFFKSFFFLFLARNVVSREKYGKMNGQTGPCLAYANMSYKSLRCKGSVKKNQLMRFTCVKTVGSEKPVSE